MIKCDQGQIEINGDFAQINTELTVLIKSVYDSFEKRMGSDLAKEMIRNAYELAFLTEEELQLKAMEMKKTASDAMFELMEKLFKNY